ncbi:hypothetical protein QCD60_05660 [Pokkaliibacter sp. MBI-7]|uniref:hypothetical protein n=1 Tax=Pokkaliibacter sp. MBI-7 TaxID=3040600 RepID=UPI00244D607D|nr:hypothetical protein [Pokkaliibacter sp. MBI-7]MDH2432041.1 hypothetical protein [Pokkaliibacter sp. MBI-7]
MAKTTGVKKLTPARAMVAELVRCYWILGMECSLLEIQKLAWFLERALTRHGQQSVLKLQFEANYYGPYAHNLTHLLNVLDGSYLQADKRIPDCNPLDVIWFNNAEQARVSAYLHSDARDYLPVLEELSQLIDGFESPFGMELLSTVDWLLSQQGCQPDVPSIRIGMAQWPAGEPWASRKLALFTDAHIGYALQRLQHFA